MSKKIIAFLLTLSALLLAQPKSLEWNFKDGLQGWGVRGFESHEITSEGFSGKVKRDAMFFSPILNINAADYDTLAVVMKCNLASTGEIFIRAKGEVFAEKKYRHHRTRDGENFLLYNLNLSNIKGWEGMIEQIRFDPINPSSDIVIQSIKLLKRGINKDSVTTTNGLPVTLPYKNGSITWRFKNGLQGWTPNRWVKNEIRPDGFHGLSMHDCSLISPELNLKAEEFDTMFVGMKSDISATGEIFISANGSVFNEKQYKPFSIVSSSELKLLTFDLKSINGWRGIINRLRFDPINPADTNIQIEFITLLKTEKNAILNGDCEIFLDGTPYGWTLKGTTVSQEAFSGTNCIAFSKSAVAETNLPNVGKLGVFQFSFKTKGESINAECVFRGWDKKTIETIPLKTTQSTVWQDNQLTITIPELAYDGILRFTGTGEAWLDTLKCTQLEEGTIVTPPPLKTTWKGQWIWCEENKLQDNCTAYVQKSFNLPNKELASADIQLTCDDSYALYVNGQLVHSTHGVADAWKKPEILDLRPFLKPGANTILAEITDVGSFQGFIADVVIVAKDGQFISLATDGKWQASVSKEGPWAPAAVLGRPPCSPWGHANYRPMRAQNSIKEPLRVTVRNLPQNVKPGQRIDLDVVVESVKLDNPIPVKYHLLQNGNTVWEDWVQNGLAMRDGKPQLTMDAFFPFKLKRGLCTMKIEFLGAPEGSDFSAEVFVDAMEKKSYEFPKVELVSQNGLTNIHVNGQLIDPTQALFTKPDQKQQIYTRDAGIHLWGISGDMGFTEHGFDYSNFDAAAEKYLSVDPNAWLIINYSVRTNTHQWWMAQHPDARCRYEDGSDMVNDYKSAKGYRPSYASKVWRETYADVLRHFIRHLKTTPYAERIVGFHSINGISAEWFHWGSQSQHFVDYSDASRDDFRRWLKAKYGTDAALQKAWARADVTFDTATIPTGKERGTPANGLYYDPKTQMNVLDYNDYQHDNCVETINYFNRIVKEETDGRVICGTYYGYTFNLFDSVFFGQGSGHYRLETMLRSPEFDYCIAPDCYGERHVGGTSKTMTPGGTFRLNGKFFWNQADLRSHWVYQRQPDGYVATVQESIDCMEREFARCMSEGNGIQWYDFSNGWTMGDKRLMQAAGKLYDLSCKYRNTVKDWAPENYLLVVLDERFMGRWNAFSNVGGSELHQNQMTYLWRAGIPWKVVLFSDLLRHPELLAHKAMLFLDAYRLTDEYKKYLEEKVLKDDRTVAFVGCPGMLTPNGLSADYCSKLMGCPFTLIDEKTLLKSKGTTTWKDLEGQEWGHNPAYKSTQFLMPTATTGCDVLATLADGRPSALYKNGKTCNLFWSAAPGLSPAVLRAIAKRAGVPVLATGNDGFYAGRGFIGIYASNEGTKEINLLGKGTPKDILTGQTWPAGTTTIKLPMRVGETRVFVVE
ncbi:MAG: beta-galactosidase [Victivallales bacterium]|nr:beta-galactosidase [Victivallales bacterium]